MFYDINAYNSIMSDIRISGRNSFSNDYTKYTYNHRLINNKIDLSECGPIELEKIPGVGMKTSRFFILHSRDTKNIAVLDVHILKFLGSLGHKVPKTTPNKNQYNYLEQKFLEHCRTNNLHPAKADLEIWKFYAKKEKEVDVNVWKASSYWFWSNGFKVI